MMKQVQTSPKLLVATVTSLSVACVCDERLKNVTGEEIIVKSLIDPPCMLLYYFELCHGQ